MPAEHAAIRERLAVDSLWVNKSGLFHVHDFSSGEVFGVQYYGLHDHGLRVRLPLESFTKLVAEGLHEITKEEEAALLARIEELEGKDG